MSDASNLEPNLDQQKELMEAINSGDLGRVQVLLDEGADPTSTIIKEQQYVIEGYPDYYMPPLWYAVYQGNFEIFQELFNRISDEDINKATNIQEEVFILDIYSDSSFDSDNYNRDIVRALLDKGIRFEDDNIEWAVRYERVGLLADIILVKGYGYDYFWDLYDKLQCETTEEDFEETLDEAFEDAFIQAVRDNDFEVCSAIAHQKEFHLEDIFIQAAKDNDFEVCSAIAHQKEFHLEDETIQELLRLQNFDVVCFLIRSWNLTKEEFCRLIREDDTLEKNDKKPKLLQDWVNASVDALQKTILNAMQDAVEKQDFTILEKALFGYKQIDPNNAIELIYLSSSKTEKIDTLCEEVIDLFKKHILAIIESNPTDTAMINSCVESLGAMDSLDKDIQNSIATWFVQKKLSEEEFPSISCIEKQLISRAEKKVQLLAHMKKLCTFSIMQDQVNQKSIRLILESITFNDTMPVKGNDILTLFKDHLCKVFGFRRKEIGICEDSNNKESAALKILISDNVEYEGEEIADGAIKTLRKELSELETKNIQKSKKKLQTTIDQLGVTQDTLNKAKEQWTSTISDLVLTVERYRQTSKKVKEGKDKKLKKYLDAIDELINTYDSMVENIDSSYNAIKQIQEQALNISNNHKMGEPLDNQTVNDLADESVPLVAEVGRICKNIEGNETVKALHDAQNTLEALEDTEVVRAFLEIGSSSEEHEGVSNISDDGTSASDTDVDKAAVTPGPEKGKKGKEAAEDEAGQPRRPKTVSAQKAWYDPKTATNRAEDFQRFDPGCLQEDERLSLKESFEGLNEVISDETNHDPFYIMTSVLGVLNTIESMKGTGIKKIFGVAKEKGKLRNNMVHISAAAFINITEESARDLAFNLLEFENHLVNQERVLPTIHTLNTRGDEALYGPLLDINRYKLRTADELLSIINHAANIYRQNTANSEEGQSFLAMIVLTAIDDLAYLANPDEVTNTNKPEGIKKLYKSLEEEEIQKAQNSMQQYFQDLAEKNGLLNPSWKGARNAVAHSKEPTVMKIRERVLTTVEKATRNMGRDIDSENQPAAPAASAAGPAMLALVTEAQAGQEEQSTLRQNAAL